MSNIEKIWRYKDLRNKVILAIVLLVFTRIIAHIPLPGVDLPSLKLFFEQNQIFGLLNMFSGGTMSQFSIVLMGVGPFITSTIIFQLLPLIFPYFDELQKEGEAGKQRLNQYSRVATVPLSVIQSFAMLSLLRSQGIIPDWDAFGLTLMLVTAAAGTMLLMWIGEIISEKGIGNGISLIITLGILAGFPSQIRNTWAIIGSGDLTKIFGLIAFIIIFIVVVAAVIYITEGQRNIPISYARKSHGNLSRSSVDSHLPIRLNVGGVIPIIFAMSVMIVPGVVGKYLQNANSLWIKNSANLMVDLFQNNTFYAVIYFVLVFLFTFFYSSVVFKPSQVSENLQKQGGFIPGLRPGKETESFLTKLISKINFLGGVFLGIVAVLPFIVQSITKINTLVLGGTGILIIVAVIIETMKQIDSQLMMHTYDNY